MPDTDHPRSPTPPPPAWTTCDGDVPAILGPVPGGDHLPPGERRERAHALLLAWYAREGRSHLPWRHTDDPYKVLVSEVMLQQTQVERVLPKYEAFLARFPTLQALAAASVAEVITAWAGLGYNSRAVRLREIAVEAVARYGGKLPSSLDDLLALKGIGRYTAGAIACFGYREPVAMVDTNIRRVLWRVFRGIEPGAWPTDETTARMVQALAEWALPRQDAYDWQQALMDLGAMICVARRPACERCPLRAVCAAYHETAAVTLFPSGEALARLRDERAAIEVLPDGHDAPQAARLVAEAPAVYASGRARKRKTQVAQPFTSTTRYFRGRIVEALRALPSGESLPLSALGPRVKPGYTSDDLPWLRGLLTRLERDGLARLLPAEDGDASGEERAALP